MCGIHFSLQTADGVHKGPTTNFLDLIRRRGPDSFQEHVSVVHTYDQTRCQLRFTSSVLALRGSAIVKQPLVDNSTGSVLCWNGEAWSRDGEPLGGNDTVSVFQAVLRASEDARGCHGRRVASSVSNALMRFRGPHAFVFYDAPNKLLFYARDCLGRRSLVRDISNPSQFILSSICDSIQPPKDWVEVEADGLYAFNIAEWADRSKNDKSDDEPSVVTQREPCSFRNRSYYGTLHLPWAFPSLNRTIPRTHEILPAISDTVVDDLHQALRQSLELRCSEIRAREIDDLDVTSKISSPATIALLFSGGLDCTVLARLLHDILHESTAIDLLNVAFENPRAHRALSDGESPYETCPDRLTAEKSCRELQAVCPGREWNLVKINVPYEETIAHRPAVIGLMRPHNTEMDLSISLALYFAARGNGTIDGPYGPTPYVSHCRVLLSGLGADEIFGGYQRHSLAFVRLGFQGLIDELELDIGRLGKRNLGRDDRVMSHWGKEVRYPYLDEDLLTFTLALPVWKKCGFGLEHPHAEIAQLPASIGEKRLLRLLAWKLGMPGVAQEKKRAIQFGARTAKMEVGNVKGTQAIS